jgi:hypothetical protein
VCLRRYELKFRVSVFPNLEKMEDALIILLSEGSGLRNYEFGDFGLRTGVAFLILGYRWETYS